MTSHSIRPRGSRVLVEDAIDVPASTRWHHAHGRQTLRQKAAKQQLLTPQEEHAIVEHILRSSRNGWPVPAKHLPHLAALMLRARSSSSCPPRRPGKNWHLGFYKRHPEVKPRRVKAMDWRRHDHSIYDKIVEWFAIIDKELSSSDVLQENVYNMDETGMLLSGPRSLRVVLDRNDMRGYRGAGSQRTLITAIECVSADGRSLQPLIIWPATGHRSNWTTHPTPGWHFACSETGYTNTAISLHWIENVFDPQTRDRAIGRPRFLIGDGFSTHHSLEIMTFCYEHNIVLCRLPSHTSHKLQPLDVSVFGPLKSAYREQVEQLFRGGSNTIGKQHFTFLYDTARRAAFTSRNIRSGWAKTGLFPFSPQRVLQSVQAPPAAETLCNTSVTLQFGTSATSMRTPTTAVSVEAMRTEAEKLVATSDDDIKFYLQKFASAATKALAAKEIVLDENRSLLVQNNEKKTRSGVKRIVIGKGKIMSYEDIEEARRKRSEKELKPRRRRGRQSQQTVPVEYVSAPTTHSTQRVVEIAAAQRAIEISGLADYCSVLDL